MFQGPPAFAFMSQIFDFGKSSVSDIVFKEKGHGESSSSSRLCTSSMLVVVQWDGKAGRGGTCEGDEGEGKKRKKKNEE